MIPTINAGWVALGLGGLGALAVAHLGWLFAQLHRHRFPHQALWQHLLRVTGLSIVTVVVYVIEGLLGLRLVLSPRDEVAFGWLAAVVVGLYVLGIVRAWTLRGDPQHSWSGWLNPLQDLVESEESDGPASKST